MPSTNLAALNGRVRRYFRQDLLYDLVAGLAGALVSVPRTMAFAVLAGLHPVYGLYSAIVPTIIGALLGSSTMMTISVTNAMALMVGCVLAPFAGEGDVLARLFTLTLLVGAIQFALGVLRLGKITRFVPDAVMTGFITGAGALLIFGQLKNLTGFDGELGEPVPLRAWTIFTHPDAIHLPTLAIGLATIIIITALIRTRLKPLAGPLAIIAASLWVAVAGWHESGVMVVFDQGNIPATLPGLPTLDLTPIGLAELGPGALAIALVGLVQSTALAQSIDKSSPPKFNASRQFWAEGVANMLGGLFRSMPSGGSLSNTALNIIIGARTRFANVFAGLIVALIVLFFGKLAEQIPMATLAGFIVVAGGQLIDLDRIRFIWKTRLADRLTMVITFVMALFFPLQYSIYAGVAFWLLSYLQSSSKAHMMRLVPVPGGAFHEEPLPNHLPDREPVIVDMSGGVHFPAIASMVNQLPTTEESQHPVVILRLKGQQFLSSAGAMFLKDYAQRLRARDGLLILSGLQKEDRYILTQTGVISALGEENVFDTNGTLLDSTHIALDYAEDWLATLPATDSAEKAPCAKAHD